LLLFLLGEVFRKGKSFDLSGGGGGKQPQNPTINSIRGGIFLRG